MFLLYCDLLRALTLEGFQLHHEFPHLVTFSMSVAIWYGPSLVAKASIEIAVSESRRWLFWILTARKRR